MKKIIQDYKGCIGCGTCVALCPEFWEMNDEDMKARPINGKKNEKTGNYELETKNVGCNKDAADACPVRVISVI
jgi:ferredoxin